MFGGAAAFNQPLDLDSAKVTTVRAYLFDTQSQLDSRFLFPIFFPTYCQMHHMFAGARAFNQTLSFDTAEVTNVRAYNCFDSNSAMRNLILNSFFPHNLIIRCATCFWMQRRTINHYLSILPPGLQMWEHTCFESNCNEIPDSWFSISISYSTYCQMLGMFRGASAFNQPLSFNTANVTNVRAYNCLESNRIMGFWFSISFPNYE